jgi:hypothetical protein
MKEKDLLIYKNSKMDNVYLVSCIGVMFDLDILPHFIKHYKKMGVKNFHFILHNDEESNDNLIKAQKILESFNIKEIDIWNGHFWCSDKERWMQYVKDKLDSKAWILTADLDEFHEYPYQLEEFIKILDDGNFNCYNGNLVNHFPFMNSLAKLHLDSDIWSLYPKIMSKKKHAYFFPERSDCPKVLLCKNYLRVRNGHHRIVSEHKKLQRSYGNKGIVNHFKWRYTLIENKKYRCRVRNMEYKFSAEIAYVQEMLDSF